MLMTSEHIEKNMLQRTESKTKTIDLFSLQETEHPMGG